MALNDRLQAGQTEAMTTAGDPRDVSDLLQHMAESVAHSTQRHGDVLADVEARLSELGQEAHEARAAVPAQFAPEFERIQDGMTQLARRIAAASRQRSTEITAPAPLRSSAPGTGGFHNPAQTTAAGIDPFDVIDHDETGHWDARSADLLARVYGAPEGEPANLAAPARALAGHDARSREPQPASAQAAIPPAEFETSAPQPAAVTPSPNEPDHHRSWLESRFAEIAGLISAVRPLGEDQAIEVLKVRFDQMEARFGAALEGLATRADVEGVRIIEAHIAELTQKFEHAEAQLASLGAIQATLDLLAERLPADRLAALFEASSRAMPDYHELAAVIADEAAHRVAGLDRSAASADMERLAHIAADLAAERVANQPGSRSPTHPEALANDELRDVITGFVQERRLGEEHTASVLETMQQALIRVLDRIDAMEIVQHAPPVAAAQGMPALVEPADIETNQPSRPDDLVDAEPDQRDAHCAAPVSPSEHDPAESEPATPAAAIPGGEIELAAQLRGPRPVRSREDFVASAQRAQRLAAVAASMTADAAPGAVLERGGVDAMAGQRPGPQAFALKQQKPAKPTSFFASLFGRFMRGDAAVAGVAAVCLGLVVSSFLVVQYIETAAVRPSGLLGLSDRAADQQPALMGEDSVAPAGHPAADTAPNKGGLVQRIGGVAAGEADAGNLSGIAVQKSSVSPDDIIRLREQQEMANLSSKLGEAAANGQDAPPAEFADLGKGSTGAVATLDMAPATVGPLSLRIAAAKGNASAEFEVGARLAEGRGTDQNFVEAIRWYSRSASHGFVQAQYRLATLYERGLGTKADAGKARTWYKRAADQGNVKAMHNLAVQYSSRQSGEPDFGSAVVYFTQAAERGLADSQFNLAVLHENGSGTPQDNVQAYKWYTLAARSGDKDAEHRRDGLKARMQPAEVLAAAELARGFAPRPVAPLANDPRFGGEQWKSRAGTVAAPAVDNAAPAPAATGGAVPGGNG